MKFFILICITFITLGVWAEEAPLEPPYTRSAEPERIQIPKPSKIDDEGNYFYGSETARDKYYKLDPREPIKSAFFLRFGTIGPYEIQSDNGKTYKQIYSKDSSFVVGFEYERMIGQLLGKWSWKLNTGLTTEQGQGSFANPNPNFTAQEKFNFFIFPNTATLSYKMRFSDTQWITPYFDGGAGYFTFIEHRDDGDKTAIGGAPVLTGSAGLLFSLTAIDQVAAATMFEDYNVKQLWLDLQYRRIEGLDDKKDFSSDMITAGFGFAF